MSRPSPSRHNSQPVNRSSRTTKARLLHIPDELKLQIFSHCDDNSFISLALTCHYLMDDFFKPLYGTLRPIPLGPTEESEFSLKHTLKSWIQAAYPNTVISYCSNLEKFTTTEVRQRMLQQFLAAIEADKKAKAREEMVANARKRRALRKIRSKDKMRGIFRQQRKRIGDVRGSFSDDEDDVEWDEYWEDDGVEDEDVEKEVSKDRWWERERYWEDREDEDEE